MLIKDSTALVTGGARGLGLAIANSLSKKGARVLVADRNTEALSSLPPNLEGLQLDVTHSDEVRSAVASIIERYSHIHILINNAGVIFSEPFVNIMNSEKMMHDYGRFRESITVNLDSVFIVTSSVVEQMVRQRTRGVIINVSSISASGNEGQTAYSAAKAGVNSMTITWSKELALWGIRCNAIAPGFIDTKSTRQALSDSILKYIRDKTPLRRLGDVEEVAMAVGALIENDYLNGVILDVNGGLRI